MNARNTLAQQAESTTISFTNTCKHAPQRLLGSCDVSREKSRILSDNHTLNDHLSLSRSRYPISVSEKRNSTPIASSFSHARTHLYVWRAYARSKVSRHIWMGGPPTHRKCLEVKEWNGPRTTPRTEFQMCVRVWRYRFCRVGPLEQSEGLKINRKAYYDAMGVVGKIAHLDRHFH